MLLKERALLASFSEAWSPGVKALAAEAGQFLKIIARETSLGLSILPNTGKSAPSRGPSGAQ